MYYSVQFLHHSFSSDSIFLNFGMNVCSWSSNSRNSSDLTCKIFTLAILEKVAMKHPSSVVTAVGFSQPSLG